MSQIITIIIIIGAAPRVGRYIASQHAYTEDDISKVRLFIILYNIYSIIM